MEYVYSIFSGLTNFLKLVQLMPSLDSAPGIFCAIAWFATLLALGLFILSLFSGGDGDMSSGDTVDAGIEGADSGLFSIRAVIGFLLGFGWGGYLGIRATQSVGLSITIGLLVGVAMFFLVAWLMRAIYGLRSDGTLNYKSLEGLTGTVYLTLPPHGEPGGQVQVAHPSQFVTMAAIQMGDQPLPAQSRIIVVEASSMQLVVKAYN